MMQFLKSILSPSKTKEVMEQQDLQLEVVKMSKRIEVLEEQILNANEIIADLSICVKNVAFATQNLSQEVMAITTVLQQATDSIRKESERLILTSSNDDDDGYLN